MECNVGKTDKMIRIGVAAVATYLGYSINPWFYVVAAIALVTATVGFCPLNKLLGINTCKMKK